MQNQIDGKEMRPETKSLLRSDLLYQYILETSVYPREPQSVKEIRELTEKVPSSHMTSSPDVMQFLSLLIKLVNAKNTLEIGVFTGHSLLATALALPDNGKILAIDISRESYEIGLPVIEKVGVAHKIDFKEGAALPILDQLLADKKNHGSMDFVFVDADKNNYLNYHKRVIDLVKIGGLIVYDNTLWSGAVLGSYDGPDKEFILGNVNFVVEFNKAVAADPRVEICQISMADGVTLCRRIS